MNDLTKQLQSYPPHPVGSFIWLKLPKVNRKRYKITGWQQTTKTLWVMLEDNMSFNFTYRYYDIVQYIA